MMPCVVMLSEVEASPRWLCAINEGCLWSALRRFFVTLRMTECSVQNDRVLLGAGLLLADERADVLNKHAHGNRVKTSLGDDDIGMFF